MVHKLRHRVEPESGFSLIEVLVVMLIIGVLAAIAIPTFMSQTTKPKDAAAKELAHTAETVAESYATDNGGKYTGLTPAALRGIEASIQVGPGNNNAYLDPATGVSNVSANRYTVTATSTNGSTFSITNNGGTVTRSCVAAAGDKNGCVGGAW